MKEDKHVIASIINYKDIEKAIKYKTNIAAVFILIGDFVKLKEIVKLFRKESIDVYIHIEMINGLKLDEFGMKYIKNEINPTGIISTKSNHIKIAKSINLFAIQRFFLADYNMLDNIIITTKKTSPDAIEIMPVQTSYLFSKIKAEVKTTIISGGLVDDVESVVNTIKNGAKCVSTSNKMLWKHEFY